MRFTVLGASGVIGSHLSKRLKDAGHDVFTPRRNDDAIYSQQLGHVIYSIGLTADFRSRPFDTMRAHVCLLADILEKSDFESLLYLSSTRIYGKCTTADELTALHVDASDPSDLYNLSKLAGEALCFSCARDSVRVARLSNVYGGDFTSDNFLTTLIRDAVDKGSVILNTGITSEKDYISIDDVTFLLPKIAIDGRYRLYNVASGLNVTNNEILEQLVKVVGCRTSVKHDAPIISFPSINISRLSEDFSFQPSSVLHDMPSLIKQYMESKL